jgi:hypothetical protein
MALAFAVICTACSLDTAPPSPVPDLDTLAPVTTAGTVPPTTQPTTPLTLPPSPPGGICRSFNDPVVAGTIEIDAVTEASGIAVSRSHAGIVWMHNDSGGGPVLYATTTAGENMGAFELDTATFDWEDMAIGPGPDPDRDYLYVGDIGDNLHFRPVVTIHRILEPTPDPSGGFVNTVEEFNLIYPDPGFDAESLFVDPLTGDVILVTKPDSSGGAATIFRAPSMQLIDGAAVDLIPIGEFTLERGLFVTAADIDSTGSVILFRGYNEVWLWQRTDIDFTETFATEPCQTPSTAEVQGEAIAFVADGYSYYTVSEGSDPDINYVESIFD